jgi:hypothetical protein
MRDETIVVKVLGAQTRLATADPAGQVVDGTVFAMSSKCQRQFLCP